jgi:hypothetical protein
MKSVLGSRRVRFILAAAAALAFSAAPQAVRSARAEPTGPASAPVQTAAEPLKIVVTAVQGTAEVKLQSGQAWQKVAAGMELPVGCQIRTGIPGVVQLKVGDDQICRIDRLSLVRVVRAEEGEGKIKTVMGMTYGRVSKDVDEPVEPHDDTIVSPTSTLAVRGTRVSLYDQPPYAPEAVSLTGRAVYTNSKGRAVRLGKKGEGTVKVNDTSDNAATYQLAQEAVASSVDNRELSALGSLARESAGGPITRDIAGLLQFNLTWSNGALANSVMDFSVTSPDMGGTVFTMAPPPTFVPSPTPPGTLSTTSGGKYITGVGTGIGDVADSDGNGKQEIVWGDPTGSFPAGTYTITATLRGTDSAVLAPGDLTATVVSVTENLPNSAPKTVTALESILGDSGPNKLAVTYTVTLPATNPKLNISR